MLERSRTYALTTLDSQRLGLWLGTWVLTGTAMLTGCGGPNDQVATGVGLFSTNNLSFGSVNVGGVSPPFTIQLSNSGDAPLKITSEIPSIGFSLIGGGCAQTLQIGDQCTLSLQAEPTIVGLTTGTLQVLMGNQTLLADLSVTGINTLAIMPCGSGLRVGQTCQMSATLDGASVTDLTWSIPLATGSGGTISASGVLTAPDQVPSTGSLDVSAASLQYPTLVASTFITVWPALPVLSSATPQQVQSGTSTVVTLTGTGLDTINTLLVDGNPVSFTPVSPNTLQVMLNPPMNSASSLAIVGQVGGPGSGNSFPLQIPVQQMAITFDAAVRFLQQAGFGPTIQMVQDVQQVGFSKWIDNQINTPAYNYAPMPLSVGAWYRNTQGRNLLLRQRVSLALGEIFVVSGNSYCETTMCGQEWEALLENDAFGTFQQLLTDVSLSPIMGTYLNNYSNWDTPVPNQNFARELMQLMSIGPVLLNQDGSTVVDSTDIPLPSYSQTNVDAMAHALSGWSSPWSYPSTAAWLSTPMSIVEHQHNHNAKTILPNTTLPAGQSGGTDLAAVIQALVQHPNSAPFLSVRLIQHLVKSDPSPAYVSRISAVFADDGTGVRGNLAAAVKAILLDPEARAGDDPNAQDPSAGHFMEPILYLTSIMNAVGGTYSDDTVRVADATMGQSLWIEPSVFSWYSPYTALADGTPAPETQLLDSAHFVAKLSVSYLTLHGQTGLGLWMNWQTSPYWNCVSVADLLNRLNHFLYHGLMPLEVQEAITQYLVNNSAQTLNNSLPDVLFLATAATNYQVIR